jgi:hypothetical protein
MWAVGFNPVSVFSHIYVYGARRTTEDPIDAEEAGWVPRIRVVGLRGVNAVDVVAEKNEPVMSLSAF